MSAATDMFSEIIRKKEAEIEKLRAALKSAEEWLSNPESCVEHRSGRGIQARPRGDPRRSEIKAAMYERESFAIGREQGRRDMEAEVERLRAALTEMVERERRRYENNDAGQAFFRKNNAAALDALGLSE